MGARRFVFVALALASGACSPAESSSEGAGGALAPAAQGAEDGGAPSPDRHDHHGGSDPEDASGPPLGPSCDEDNPASTIAGTTDRALPDPILQFERHLGWGCVHREYHETRQWDFIANNPNFADRFAYVQKMKWTRAAVQEGAPGSGLDFLAMHRVMLGTLRDRFPEHAHLFEGWSKIPTEATVDDPLAPNPDGSAPAAFRATMNTAIARLETDLESFVTEDELGRYIETQHRPTAQDPLARSTDNTAGLHTYIHVRFDDYRSAIRMQRFNRNIESETFFRLHGWVDRLWTQWRTAKSMKDETDQAYGEAMHHACMHMGLMSWDIARRACTS